jgi:hypothetical protein
VKQWLTLALYFLGFVSTERLVHTAIRDAERRFSAVCCVCGEVQTAYMSDETGSYCFRHWADHYRKKYDDSRWVLTHEGHERVTP